MIRQLSLFDFPASSPKVETIAPSPPRLRKGAKVLRKEKMKKTNELREIARVLGPVAIDERVDRPLPDVGERLGILELLVDGHDSSDIDGVEGG